MLADCQVVNVCWRHTDAALANGPVPRVCTDVVKPDASRTNRPAAGTQAPGRRRGPLLSPLRYPGGKRRLVRYIERFFELNELRPAVFVEPFAGGASVSLHVLQRNLVEEVILADLDPLVAGFWKTVFDPAGSQWLVDRIMSIPVTLAKWREFKAAQPRSDRERALTCLFLNRTSFSGILNERAGPLGGIGQTSEYPIDCRFPRDTLAHRVAEIAAYRDRVRVWHKPWRETLGRVGGMQRALRVARCRTLSPRGRVSRGSPSLILGCSDTVAGSRCPSTPRWLPVACSSAEWKQRSQSISIRSARQCAVRFTPSVASASMPFASASMKSTRKSDRWRA
jgi:hypothetical protein